jgi:hypothetical protein
MYQQRQELLAMTMMFILFEILGGYGEAVLAIKLIP